MDSHYRHDKQPARDAIPRNTLRPPGIVSPGQAAYPHLSAPTPPPQTQWGSVPTHFRPPSWTYSDIRDKPLPEPPIAQSEPSSIRRKKRPESLRGRAESSSSSNMLYPQTNPYDMAELPRSAPHDRRYFSPTMDDEGMNASALPRSPTYPGASSRVRSPSESNESALRDEEDIRLFMEATTGLGPIPTFRQNSVIEDTWLQSRPHDPDRPISRGNIMISPSSNPSSTIGSAAASRYASAISPVAETPMAYAPYSGVGHPPFDSNPSQRRSPPSDVASYGAPGRTSHTQAHPQHSQSWMAANDPPETDEELPTYASSQAQAQQSQRVEAARRAQELQRRWREGGRKYGPDM